MWDRIKAPLIAGLLLVWFSAIAITVVATHKPVQVPPVSKAAP